MAVGRFYHRKGFFGILHFQGPHTGIMMYPTAAVPKVEGINKLHAESSFSSITIPSHENRDYTHIKCTFTVSSTHIPMSAGKCRVVYVKLTMWCLTASLCA